MNFTESIKTVLFDKYATIKGRAPRSEFWWWVLFIYLFGFLIGALMTLNGVKEEVFDAVSILVNLVFLIPTYVVMARRFHDIGLSGWYVLWFKIALIASFSLPLLIITSLDLNISQDVGIPLIWICMIIVFGYFTYLLTKKGDDSDNQYGPNPLLEKTKQEQFVGVNEDFVDGLYNELTVKELKDLANKKGVKLLSKDTKAVIIKKLSK